MTLSWIDQLDGLDRIGFDTNALIYYLERRPGYFRYVAEAVDMIENRKAIGVVSTVVEMELLVKPLREQDFTSRNRIETFLRQQANLFIRPVDRTVARRAADVRARTRLDALDAIILATCLEEGCDAIIGNDSDIAANFSDIPYMYLEDFIQ